MTEKKATETRRDEIIKASLRLIEMNGLDNLSIANIATEINLVPSAIYRHFGSKEEIIISLIDFVERSLQANVLRVVKENDSAVNRLEALYALHADFLKTQPAIPRIVFSLLAANKNLTLKERIFAVITNYAAKIKDILADGQSNGDIAPSIDPAAAAMLFVGMVQPLIIFSQMETAEPVDGFKQTMWSVYARGIKK